VFLTRERSLLAVRIVYQQQQHTPKKNEASPTIYYITPLLSLVQHGRQLYIYIYIIVEKVVNLSGGTGGVYPLPIIILNHHENKARDIPRLHDTHTPLFYTTTSLPLFFWSIIIIIIQNHLFLL
jgi:hypothetical protein